MSIPVLVSPIASMTRPGFFLIFSALIFLVGCGDPNQEPTAVPGESPSTRDKASSAANSIHLVFTAGSEKEKWIDALTSEFNTSQIKISSGEVIHVEHIPMGSGECISEILDGKRETHLVSPASEAFIKLGNAESQARLGKDLVGETENLVLSPVVIAMWKPMAEALGWPERPLGWADVHAMALDKAGWGGKGFPQWGRFRFGHTHPEYSNSGIISLFAETYAGTGKVQGLTLEDVANPATGTYLEEIESAIVHYGRSTGFFGRKMFENGPEYLSAAVLYENMVIESYEKADLPFPIVAIYPKEGTFYSDHPVGIVDRDWVTPAHREAAEKYIGFLTETAQQERAKEFGFRPADVSLDLGAPFDAAHGVDAAQPQTTLEVPEVPVMQAIQDLWKERKKKSNIVLVLDTSGSMKHDEKMQNAKTGARQLISMLGDQDLFSLLPFNDQNYWLAQDLTVGQSRAPLTRQVDSLFANGGTALYDALAVAHTKLAESPEANKITAIVVLSDGADEHSQTTLEQVLAQISATTETGGVRVFTIGYGEGARSDVLEKIAEATRGKYFEGTPKNIDEVFKEISTFF